LGFSAGAGVTELLLAEEVGSEPEEGRSCGMATPPTSKNAAARTLHLMQLDFTLFLS